jgi:26S proteasome regulatory subunit N3
MSNPPADKKQTTEPEKKETNTKPVPLTVLQSIRSDLLVIERAIGNKDYIHASKTLRNARKYKKRLTSGHLHLIWQIFGEGPNFKNYSDYKELSGETFEITKAQAVRLLQLKEVVVYLQALLLVHLVKIKDLERAREVADNLVAKILEANKRHLDVLSSWVYFNYARTYELLGRFREIRKPLFDLYRHCCLKRDEAGQATLLNLLLRNYLHSKNYESAVHLISKTNFPENKSNNELIRYLYYTGKIKAVQLEYTDAYGRLMQAIRKAPESVSALGFRLQAHKLAIVVELLMGEIPDRNIFSSEQYSKYLKPYYALVQTVLTGNLEEFRKTIAAYNQAFVKDKLLSLINRLHQNVIKTGLRRISISYSRISLRDIAEKLHLDANQDVEFIVAKAIRDGVMIAKIDHEQGLVYLREKKDLYATTEPEQAFKKRIEFCFNLYDASTKALQYPVTEAANYEVEKPDYDPEDLIKMAEEEDDEL